MSECIRTDTCVFFTDEVGYSPELWSEMRSAYCLVGDPTCARFRLLAYMTAEEIPRDLIPTDAQRADALIAEFEASTRG